MFKRPKYNAKKTVRHGIKFDSLAEADYFDELIKTHEVECQPKIYLSKAKILYKPDFKIIEDGKVIYIDVKGMETPVFKIKKRLWKAYQSDELRIIKRSGKRFKLAETVHGNSELLRQNQSDK
jgi:predicted nuclease of restriction endonuclease-like RecB superfamily